MMSEKQIAGAGVYQPAQPVIRTIGPEDLFDALAKGFADFKAMPTHVLFLCIIYPLVVLVAARISAGYETLPLVFPLLAGYTLIGPLVATGMYELSRCRERGTYKSRSQAFDPFRSSSIGSIAMLGVVLMVVYFAWLGAAQGIYTVIFGGATPESVTSFIIQVLTTASGWALMIVGSTVGLVFAIVALSLSVVSFPMLLDREVGVMTAVRTSIRAVRANPLTMGLWGIIVASMLAVGTVPFFIGLAIVMPVLGHASWHLYRKVVAN